MRKLIFLFAIFSATLISCDAKKSTSDATSNPESLNGNWEINSISRTKLTVNELYPDRKPFITFNVKESKASGNTGCNSFTGNISSMSNGEIVFDEAMAMTKMFCDGGGESVFMENMKAVTGFSFTDDGKTLILTEKDGKEAMRLTKK